jgi:hypothetical protein
MTGAGQQSHPTDHGSDQEHHDKQNVPEHCATSLPPDSAGWAATSTDDEDSQDLSRNSA